MPVVPVAGLISLLPKGANFTRYVFFRPVAYVVAVAGLSPDQEFLEGCFIFACSFCSRSLLLTSKGRKFHQVRVFSSRSLCSCCSRSIRVCQLKIFKQGVSILPVVPVAGLISLLPKGANFTRYVFFRPVVSVAGLSEFANSRFSSRVFQFCL